MTALTAPGRLPPDRLLLDGQPLTVAGRPFDDYLLLARQGAQPARPWPDCAGCWEVVGGRLYLVGLAGTLDGVAPASLEHFFPGFGHRVFAHWYSGMLWAAGAGPALRLEFGRGELHRPALRAAP